MQGPVYMKKKASSNHINPQNDPTIAWVKWHNPFSGRNLDDVTLDEKEDDVPYKDSYDTANHSEPGVNGPAIMTPMGIVPITEYTDIEKIFKFWNGHTNFDIDENVFAIIEETPGVESFDVFTRYRFRIGIGQLFKDRDVMNAINNNVKHYLASGTG